MKRLRNFLLLECDSSGSVDLDTILIELLHFNDSPSSVPFSRISTNLILDTNVVSNFQWWKWACTDDKALANLEMTLTKGFFTFLHGVLPSWVWLILPWEDWHW